MNQVQEECSPNSTLVLEKVDIISKATDRFRRQVQQAISLQKKINLLLDELKRLEVSIKTTSKEINLSIKELKESSTIFTEAVDPSSDDWTLQYLLRKNEEAYSEMDGILQNYFESGFRELSRKSLS